MANPPSFSHRRTCADQIRKVGRTMKFISKLTSKPALYTVATIVATVAASGAGLKWN